MFYLMGYTSVVILTPFILGVLGLIVGSFLNVVILRFGEKGIGGRSECPSCHTTLAWYDLVPVFSWIFLLGTCRYCKARISIQYPLVEASTAILFAFIAGAELPLLLTALSLIIVSLLVCIFVYDLRHQLIPDMWVWSFCAIALIGVLIFPAPYLSPLYVLLAGPIAMLPILFLWALSRPFAGMYGAWMGFGDVKLALGMGWLLAAPTALGLPLGLVAVFLAFIIGALMSVCILLPLPYYMQWWRILLGHPHAAKWSSTRPVGASGYGSYDTENNLPTTTPMSDHDSFHAGYTMKSEVPFGPFLITSCFLVWCALLYHVSVPFLI